MPAQPSAVRKGDHIRCHPCILTPAAATPPHTGTHSPVTALGRAAPLGRVAEADDVADTVVAMVSDLTRHTTGAFVPVDGGATML